MNILNQFNESILSLLPQPKTIIWNGKATAFDLKN